MENIKVFINYIAASIEIIGCITIFTGVLYSLIKSLVFFYKKKPEPFIELRQTLGKSILLGLEILIAADIIATVVAEPTLELELESVSILGLIVFIRTIMSLSLQVELEGKFPWQKIKFNSINNLLSNNEIC